MTRREKPDCGSCIYRAKDHACYTCDYAGVTGKTRKAVPPEKCRNYIKGDRIEQERPESVPPAVLTKKNVFRMAKKYDEALIKKLYDEGAGPAEIVRKTHCSRSWFYCLKAKWGPPAHPMKAERMRKYDWKRAAELYEKGATVMEIAEALGCSYQDAWGWHKRKGLMIHPAKTR